MRQCQGRRAKQMLSSFALQTPDACFVNRYMIGGWAARPKQDKNGAAYVTRTRDPIITNIEKTIISYS
jgi:hypothetical protein